eukprot:GEMP01060371.1.p1 GENE.GEMP01060371.1~~GEMP01060371.1.p1  ORF type:complete len:375 (+),score=77.60 GEMP01060371.1:46-1170(+)
MVSLVWYALAGRRCLEGVQAGYYWSRPWSRDVETVIYFEGGGWCYGLNEQETIDECAAKQWQWWSKGNSWMWLPWYLGDLTEGRNVVFVPNCDWTSLTGTSGEVHVTTSDGTNKTLYFEGFNILNDTLDSIKSYIVPWETGTTNKPVVIVSGGSAGGSAVYYHADFVQEKLPETKIVAVPDAAFFLNLTTLNGTDIWPEQMRQMSTIAQSRLQSKCEETLGDSRCLFPQYFAHLSTVPTFVLNSLYDTSELQYTLQLPYNCRWNETRCTREELAALCGLREQHLTALELLLQKNTTGAFLTNTLKHHILRTDHTIDNTTLDDAFKDWLNGTIGNTTLNDTVNGCLNGTFVLIDGPRSACVPAREVPMNASGTLQ